MKKLVKIIAFVAAMMFILSACTNNSVSFTSDDGETTIAGSISNILGEDTAGDDASSGDNASATTHTKVKFTMENGGTFIIELYPEYAPKTVDNFISLVNEGFYDGLTFHRVIKNFMAQGGDPLGTGTGGSDKEIYGEFLENGYSQNTLSHTRGVVSMARSSDPNSASSQFFICYEDVSYSLDGKYAAFGKVIEGMEVVDAFLEIERVYDSSGSLSRPVEPIVIEKAEVIL